MPYAAFVFASVLPGYYVTAACVVFALFALHPAYLLVAARKFISCYLAYEQSET